MLKDAKYISPSKDHVRGRVTSPKERDEFGRIVPHDKISKMELLPTREKSRPYSAWKENGGRSWNAMGRWLLSKVGRKFRLNEAPQEWRKEIQDRLTWEKCWLSQGHTPYHDTFYLDPQGILRYFPKKKYRWKKPLSPVTYFDFRYYSRLGGIWYEILRFNEGYHDWNETERNFRISDKWCGIAEKRQVASKLAKKLTEIREKAEREFQKQKGHSV